ncbi:MAG: hypothetical protein R3B89_08525 [Polyangiaceae bacterium]
MSRGAEITPPRISVQGLRRSGTRELRGEPSGFEHELVEPRDTVPDGLEPFEALDEWERAGDTIPAPMSASPETQPGPSVPKAPAVPSFSDLNQELAATSTGQRVLGNVLPTQPRGKG